MKTTVEFVVVINGRPYIYLATEVAIAPVLADIRSRDHNGQPCNIEVYKQTTEPYELGEDNDK